MSTSTTLTTFSSLANDTSATTDLNNNFAAINTAMSNSLALNGQAPNQMQSNLDMNSNQIINLPLPNNPSSPIRLTDVTLLNGSGTITALPVGGTTGQVLTKTSNANYATNWQTPPNVPFSSPNSWTAVQTFNNSDIALLGSSTGATTLTSANAGASNFTVTIPAFNDTLVGLAATQTLTNKTLTSPALTSPTLTTPSLGVATATSINSVTLGAGQISGTATNDNASAGNIGQYVTSGYISGVATSSSVALNIASISLTAGDWELTGTIGCTPAATTVLSQLQGVFSLASASFASIEAGSFMILSGTLGTGAAGTQSIAMPASRVSLTSTTTIYLNAFAVFTTSTLTTSGILRARRVR